MNVEQKVATLEALLARVKRNAAEARPPRAHLHVVGPVDADDLEATQDLPPELAHAVLPAPASSRTPAVVSTAASPKPPPVESPKPPIVESPKPAPVEAAPESKPRLVALSPPLATAGRGGPVRSPTPTYGVPAQRPAESPKPAPVRPITPQAPPVIAKPITPSVGPKPSVSRPAPAPKTAAKADAPTGAPVHERSGSKTLMGTGLDEMRRALAQLDTKAAPAASSPPLAGAQIIADDSTGEGATMVRSSPLERSLPQMAKQDLVEEASTEDEQTVLIPQPTQEELIAASERAGTGARRKLIEDESSEGDTLVKDSPFSAQLIEAEPPTVSKPTPAAQQPAAAAPKVGAMGTMMMPVSPSASPPVASSAPAAPPPPATTASKTVIMEPALATTVQSEAPPEPPPPAPPPPVEMPLVAGASGVMPGPMGGVDHSPSVDDARPLPVQPSFLRDGPVYEAPLPRKKKSRAGAFGVGLAAAALVAAGVFLSLRNGWLDDFIGSGATTASPSATAVVPASAAPSAKASAAPTAAEAASEVPATAAPPASAAPKASASAVASAAPSAAPSAKPAAEAGDASALPKNKGILMVTSTQPGVVYVNGKFVGNAGEPLTVECGIKYIRLAAEGASPGKTPTFVGHGRPLKIACRATTTAELPAAAGLDGPQAPAGDVPSPGNPAPDL